MKYYEKLYQRRNDSDNVFKDLFSYLLYQIYSVPVLRICADEGFEKYPDLFRKNTPAKIVELIEISKKLSDQKLQSELNRYLVKNAIDVLKGYQNCAVPLTNDPTVPTTTHKLTSDQGDQNLKILQQADCNQQYTDSVANLAVRCSHKFLFDDTNFRKWNISAEFAHDVARYYKSKDDSEQQDGWVFPVIQLTKGCPNHCSHCSARAENHLSHMPWPVFVNLYRGFYRHYKDYPQHDEWHYFCQFFFDSDMLSYSDSVIGTDSGDVALFICNEGAGLYHVMTRGVRDEQSKLALQKILVASYDSSDAQVYLSLSCVDTPKDRVANQRQLGNTLDAMKELPEKILKESSAGCHIEHLHLKSGPVVSDEIFTEFTKIGWSVRKGIIYSTGRAKDEFSPNKMDHIPDDFFMPPFVIQPNGKICLSDIKDGELKIEPLRSLYDICKHKICKHKKRIRGRLDRSHRQKLKS